MIHRTAIIDSEARLGTDVHVGPYTCIERGVEIGDHCSIGPHVCILRYTTLGPRCRVHAGAVLGDVPQDTAFAECESWVRIGADCVIREGVTVHRGTKPGTVTEVGDGCWLMACSHVGHNVRLGRRVILANAVLLAGYVTVGDGAFLSGNVVVHQFCRVGRLAMLGGNGSLSKDVAPFCLTRGGALNGLAGLNVVGIRRAGWTDEERRAVKEAFRILFRSGLNMADGVAAAREAVPGSAAAAEMCDFVESSARGVCVLDSPRRARPSRELLL